MRVKIVIVGVGGQGILFLTRLLSEAARALGHEVIGTETHGMSQRGGSVISHLKVNCGAAPLVRRGTADVLLALDPDEAYRALGFLRNGGVAFVNTGRPDFPSPEIAARLSERNITVYTLNADAVASELGSPALANVVLLGFASGHPGFPWPHEAIVGAVKRVGKVTLRRANERALAQGYAAFSPTAGLLRQESPRSPTPSRHPPARGDTSRGA